MGFKHPPAMIALINIAKDPQATTVPGTAGVYDEIDRWFNDGANRLLQIRDSDGQGNHLRTEHFTVAC